MILIITNSSDATTYEVVEWLEKLQKRDVVILCSENELKVISISKHQVVLKYSNRLIDINKVELYWYRKGDIYFDNELLVNEKYQYFDSTINSEVYDLHYAIHTSLIQKNGIGDYFHGNLNRITTLLLANSLGINTPDFCITSNKNELRSFTKHYDKVIIRSINQGLSYTQGEWQYVLYVNLFERTALDRLPRSFYPTLFMQYIEKVYEIRSFYLKGKFYSMAIFSQESEQTTIDFRNYDSNRPNRTVPYILPDYIAQNLHMLMQKLKLDTGSIDLIFSKGCQYFFLEVNPVGQFGMVSKPCNYYLELEMAMEIIKCNEK